MSGATARKPRPPNTGSCPRQEIDSSGQPCTKMIGVACARRRKERRSCAARSWRHFPEWGSSCALRAPGGFGAREPDALQIQVAGFARPNKWDVPETATRASILAQGSRPTLRNEPQAAAQASGEGGSWRECRRRRRRRRSPARRRPRPRCRFGHEPRRQGHRLRRRHRPHSLPVLPPRSGGDDRLRPRAVDRAFRAHPDGGACGSRSRSSSRPSRPCSWWRRSCGSRSTFRPRASSCRTANRGRRRPATSSAASPAW